MKVVVVGGQTRNIRKTSVMAGLIRDLKPLGWTAVKITQYGHGICSRDVRPWPDLDSSILRRKRVFPVFPPSYANPELSLFVQQKLGGLVLQQLKARTFLAKERPWRH